MIVMPGTAVNTKKSLTFIVVAVILCLSLSVSAFAAEGKVFEVEDATDEVAELEEAAAKASAAAAAEAAKVNEVVDLDADSAKNESDEIVPENALGDSSRSASEQSGPLLALAVAAVLILFGCLTIAASNRKLKAGRLSKTGR